MQIMQLLKKYWYGLAMSLMAVILSINLLGGFRRFADDPDSIEMIELGPTIEGWQLWLNRNSLLFKPLSDGAKIGIARTKKSAEGVLITKSVTGLVATGSARIREAGPGVIIILDDELADSLQSQTNARGSLNLMLSQASTGRIIAYNLLDGDVLRKGGYLKFLSNIGMLAQ